MAQIYQRQRVACEAADKNWYFVLGEDWQDDLQKNGLTQVEALPEILGTSFVNVQRCWNTHENLASPRLPPLDGYGLGFIPRYVHCRNESWVNGNGLTATMTFF